MREVPSLTGVWVRELLEPLGCRAGKTVVDDYLREVRPLFAPVPRTFARAVWRPGEVCQFDVWQPRAEVPVGHAQTRRGYVVVACLGYARVGAGALVFSTRVEDLLAGVAGCLVRLGGLPEVLPWDRQAGIHGHQGRPSEAFDAFCGQLRIGWRLCAPADPQAKGPAARALPTLADRARAEEWTFERFAAALLKTETDSRDSHGGQARIKQARFPARKTLEEFDFAFQTSLRRETVLHLGHLDYLAGRENVVLLGPPGTGKTHLSIALGIRACLAGHRVAFRTATEWVALLADAQRQGHLDDELTRLQRIPLLIVDEVGYIPFDPHAANLMFMLVSRRYERASLIVTASKPFSGWGEIFGHDVAAAAMIDRLVHHAEIVALKGESYRLKHRDLARPTRDD